MTDALAPLRTVQLRQNRNVFAQLRQPGRGRPANSATVSLSRSTATDQCRSYQLQQSIRILAGPAEDFLDLLEEHGHLPHNAAAAQKALASVISEIGYAGFSISERERPLEATILRPHRLFKLNQSAAIPLPIPSPQIEVQYPQSVLLKRTELDAKPAPEIEEAPAVREMTKIERNFLNEAKSFLKANGKADQIDIFLSKVNAIKAEDARLEAQPQAQKPKTQTAFANPDILPSLIGQERAQVIMQAVRSYGAATIDELRQDFRSFWDDTYRALQIMTNVGVLSHSRVPIRKGRRAEVWMLPDMRRKIARLEGYVF